MRMDPDPTIDDLSFEDALKALEAIVSQLEGGQLSLEESIRQYERGSRLRQRCEDRLAAAQTRIEAIRLDGEGRPTGVQPFAAD